MNEYYSILINKYYQQINEKNMTLSNKKREKDN